MQHTVRHIVLLLLALAFPLHSFAQGPQNALKMTLLSLGSGSTRISYEHTIGHRHTAELTIGVIGAGFDILNRAQPSGYLVKAAYKWNLKPQAGANTALAGLYFKPELIWADYNYLYDNQPSHTRQVALLAEGGYQLILNWFLFDIYCGLGPTIGTGNKHNYYHGFVRYPMSGPIGWTAGFRLGVAF